jgi:uncharacterized protein YndB with AHSA1/START domain
MDQQPVIHNTFVVERSYPVKPERVFAAFADPAQKRRWYAEGEQNGSKAMSRTFALEAGSITPSASKKAIR